MKMYETINIAGTFMVIICNNHIPGDMTGDIGHKNMVIGPWLPRFLQRLRKKASDPFEKSQVVQFCRRVRTLKNLLVA